MPKDPKHTQLASDLRTVVTRLNKKLRNQSSTAGLLSQTERSIIFLLDRQPQMLPSELAAVEKITTQSMSQILNHLSELELIDRTPSTLDKRKVNISLSQAGHNILNKVRNERDEWLNKALMETCTNEELSALRAAIVPLTKLVDFE